MRKILFILLALIATAAMAQGKVKDHVEVVYFHGKQRCLTCMAIEKYAREVVDTDFAREKQSGKVLFRTVDITSPEGAKLAKKYRVSWSSLYINGWKGGKEKRNDLTAFAFNHARKHTAEFKKEVKKTIQKNLP